jgi:hypothetical protein
MLSALWCAKSSGFRGSSAKETPTTRCMAAWGGMARRPQEVAVAVSWPTGLVGPNTDLGGWDLKRADDVGSGDGRARGAGAGPAALRGQARRDHGGDWSQDRPQSAGGARDRADRARAASAHPACLARRGTRPCQLLVEAGHPSGHRRHRAPTAAVHLVRRSTAADHRSGSGHHGAGDRLAAGW